MAALNEQDPFIGTLLSDKYKIKRRIGHGGMGAVYEGLHVLMERPVAIKVVHARWASTDPACLQRFHLEAKTSSCLNHPNIMQVFDFGISSDGLAYLVMDYIVGEGLDELLRRERRMEVERVVDVFGQACDGLAHAHDKGIVHRDLKPSNLMITRTDAGKEQVKIVDFGIAKIMPGRERSLNFSPRDSQVVGSPLYMSPEQCMGDASLDGRADVYQLGCLLYQALTGRPPITATNVLGIIYAHINETPKPFAVSSPDVQVPPQIEAVVMRALSKKPEDRQQNMRELKDELRSALAAWQAQAAPYTVPGPQELDKETALNPDLVPRIHQLADFYRSRNQPHKAEEHLRAAVSCLVGAYGVWDLRVAEAVKKLADFYREVGKFAEAEPLYLDLLAIKRKALGGKHPDIPCILLCLADTYFNTTDYESAKRYYWQCLQLAEMLFGPDDPVLVPILTGLAGAERRLNNEADAEKLYLRVLELKEVHFGPDHYEMASTLVGLGVIYRYRNELSSAEHALGRALMIYEQSVGTDHDNVASVLLLLGELYSAQGSDADAEDLYARAVNIREAMPGEDLELAGAYEVWGAHHLRKQDLDMAEVIYRKALSIKERALGENHPQIADSLSVLAALYQAQKRFDIAEEYYKRAVACSANESTVAIRLSEP